MHRQRAGAVYAGRSTVTVLQAQVPEETKEPEEINRTGELRYEGSLNLCRAAVAVLVPELRNLRSILSCRLFRKLS